jgi:hypothetical protein
MFQCLTQTLSKTSSNTNTEVVFAGRREYATAARPALTATPDASLTPIWRCGAAGGASVEHRHQRVLQWDQVPRREEDTCFYRSGARKATGAFPGFTGRVGGGSQTKMQILNICVSSCWCRVIKLNIPSWDIWITWLFAIWLWQFHWPGIDCRFVLHQRDGWCELYLASSYCKPTSKNQWPCYPGQKYYGARPAAAVYGRDSEIGRIIGISHGETSVRFYLQYCTNEVPRWTKE